VSGLLGIVSVGGAPVNHGLLQQMTSFLSFRGPDAQEVWRDGPAGLGHAMLRTERPEASGLIERQPCTLDGQVWIAADVRLDDRSSLIERLAAESRSCFRGDPDAILLLHAYHAWGEQCVEHLLGDFAFAIWDAARRLLFCASSAVCG
jgi:asparagine synthase (glutamine-hydrolysing)